MATGKVNNIIKQKRGTLTVDDYGSCSNSTGVAYDRILSIVNTGYAYLIVCYGSGFRIFSITASTPQFASKGTQVPYVMNYY